MDNKKNEDIPFSKKMFEFIEVEIDEEVEQALMESKIGYSWFEEEASVMQERFKDMGLSDFKVIALSKKKFLISKHKQENWDAFNKTDLSVWFSHIRSYEETDHILTRVAWLECVGLPMPAWKEDNLRAFTDRFGKWVNWSYQSDDLGEFFNPLICIDMFDHKQIGEEMTILYKGKQIKIKFKEITDVKHLQGKVLPMDFGPEDSREVTTRQGEAKTEKYESKGERSDSKREIENANKALVTVASNDESPFNGRIEDSVESSVRVQENLFKDFRRKSGSSEVCTEGSLRMDDLSKSELELASENASSQSTLCSGIVRQLKVKGNRGRPRKKGIAYRNPFEIKGGFKWRKKGRGKGRASQKAKKMLTEVNYLQAIPSNVVGSSVKQALNILEAAENIGLAVKGNREEVVREIARKLELKEL